MKVEFIKKETNRTVGTNSEPLTDEIFATMSETNQTLILIAETYTTVPIMVVKYQNGYGISRDSLSTIRSAMQL